MSMGIRTGKREDAVDAIPRQLDPGQWTRFPLARMYLPRRENPGEALLPPFPFPFPSRDQRNQT